MVALALSLALHAAGLLALFALVAPPAGRETLLPLRLLRLPAETAAVEDGSGGRRPQAAPPASRVPPPAAESKPPARVRPAPRAAASRLPALPAQAAEGPAAAASGRATVAAAGVASAEPAVQSAAEGSGSSLPSALLRGGYQRRPVYPRAALLRGAEGETLLRVRVLASGRVREVRFEHSAGRRDLDRAAAGAVRQWRFEPFGDEVRETEVWVLIPIRFELDDSREEARDTAYRSPLLP
jgi:protein TonB